MTLGIMQPYLFPYIGYWQLINAVNTFVIYDDVNFIKQGYINRNSILTNGKSQQITLELIGASQNKLINEISVGNNKNKVLKTIKQNYSKAPYYNEIIIIIEEILNNEEKNLAKFIGFSLMKISNYLGINTKFMFSSDIEKNNDLKAQEKVLEICKILQANKYINAIGGQELYSKAIFRKNKMELNFLKTKLVEYKQFNYEFVAYLSIIDVLMFNDKKKVIHYLNDFELI